MKKFIFLLSILLFTIQLFSQRFKPDTLMAFRTTELIKLDGILNETCWENAIPINTFWQREQNEGEPATEETKIAVVYTKNEIVFGIWCFDSDPSSIQAQKMARDFSWSTDDNVEIMISPFNDNRNGYLFVTNPNGAIADVYVGDEGKSFNEDWNGVWDVAVHRNEKGWFVEMVIPFSTLKFPKDSSQTWGINFERNIRRKKEQVMWQGWSRLYDVEKISQGGKLSGLENIKSKNRFEIKPYLLAGFEKETDVDASFTKKIGGEVNFDITPTLKLNLTANTDFAQVESDKQQINLSRFSLYYEEKRQFFLEGKNYYDMNIGSARINYSRRIGIDGGEEVPVIGGMRLFGKLNRTNIGIMSIQTNAKDTIPMANFSVIRIKQDIFKQSNIGFIATSKFTDGNYNITYGGDFSYSTSELFGDKNLDLSGAFAISSSSALETNKNKAYNFKLSYPNDLVEFDLGLTTVEKDFNPETGFVNRSNYQMFYSELQFNPRFKIFKFFRNMELKPMDLNYYINEQTRDMETFTYEWRPFGAMTKSGEFVEFNVIHIFDKPEEDFELIDDVIIEAGSYWYNQYEVQMSSFKGRSVSGSGEIRFGEFYTGQRTTLEFDMNFNLNKHLNISLDWEKNYITVSQNSFTTDEIGGRIDYSFNPKLATSLYAQWNNEDDNILLNYRINWIPKIGSFFYFVINQSINTENNGFEIERTTVLGKLIWRFAI